MKLISALLLSVYCLSANAETPCDEWANFAKIITYRFRDVGGHTVTEVQDELKKSRGNDPEIDKALGWIGYSFAHPELSPVQIWEGVYTMCTSKPTLQP